MGDHCITVLTQLEVSIPVAILSSCQYMKNIAFYLFKREYSWMVKIQKKLRGSTQSSQYVNLRKIIQALLGFFLE